MNRLDPTLTRRVMGTAAAVLVIALATVILDFRYAPERGSYEVTAELGRAGSGVRAGTDVKIRGARVGEVTELSYTDGIARARLTLDPEPRLPAPERLEMFVTPKTLLGEKQIEIRVADDGFGQEPFLEPGDTVVASQQPTEITEAIDALEPFLASIDPQDLATIVDTLGDQRGEGEVIAENIELGQELAEFGERTASDTFDRLSAFTDVTDALTLAVPDLTRLNTTLPDATSILTERQADIRANLEAVSRFAPTFTETLVAEESTISRFVRTSQPVGDVLERQQDQIGELINGVFLYSRALGSGGLLLDDGSEWAPFRIFVSLEDIDPIQLLCLEFDDILGQRPPLLCDGVEEFGG